MSTVPLALPSQDKIGKVIGGIDRYLFQDARSSYQERAYPKDKKLSFKESSNRKKRFLP
jgi:hypothetical protein